MMEEMEEKVVELFPGSKFVPVGDSTVLQVHEEEPLSEFDWSVAIEPLYKFGHALNWCCCISSIESNSVLQPGQQDSETILRAHHRLHRRKAMWLSSLSASSTPERGRAAVCGYCDFRLLNSALNGLYH